MTLQTSRKVLKISGILCIIGSFFLAIAGIFLLVGVEMAKNSAEVDVGEYGPLIKVVGIVTIITGVLVLIEGIVSILASKNNKYGSAAWAFSVAGMLSSVINPNGDLSLHSYINALRLSGSALSRNL